LILSNVNFKQISRILLSAFLEGDVTFPFSEDDLFNGLKKGLLELIIGVFPSLFDTFWAFNISFNDLG
jgi:hypothetical protein